jgi:hypothetical protein
LNLDFPRNDMDRCLATGNPVDFRLGLGNDIGLTADTSRSLISRDAKIGNLASCMGSARCNGKMTGRGGLTKTTHAHDSKRTPHLPLFCVHA